MDTPPQKKRKTDHGRPNAELYAELETAIKKHVANKVNHTFGNKMLESLIRETWIAEKREWLALYPEAARSIRAIKLTDERMGKIKKNLAPLPLRRFSDYVALVKISVENVMNDSE